METEARQTMMVWKKTQKLLRLIAANTGESLVVTMHRLAEEEYQRIQKEQQKEQKSGESDSEHGTDLPLVSLSNALCSNDRSSNGSSESLEPLCRDPQASENEPCQMAWAQ
jgi:hypothetical protein